MLDTRGSMNLHLMNNLLFAEFLFFVGEYENKQMEKNIVLYE